MGNKSAKITNKETVYFRFRKFAIESLPTAIYEWNERIDQRTWDELTRCCQNAVPNVTYARRTECLKYERYSKYALLPIIIGS